MIANALRFACALVVAALAAACSTPPVAFQPTASVSTFDTQLDWSDFALGPNDIVHVGVYGHPELGAEGTRVDSDGDLSLPLVGAVRVAGLSTAEARAAVTEAYAKYIALPRVDLSIVQQGARRCYVVGEVTRGGPVVLDRPMTVLQGLSLAGGFTPRADRENVVLLRGRPEALEVEVLDLEQPGARSLLALRPEDVLFVRRTNAGRFTDEILPYLQGISSSLYSAATLVLIEDRLKGRN